MRASVADTWDRLDTAISPQRTRLQRKPSRSSSPELAKRRLQMRSTRENFKANDSVTRSQNVTILADQSKRQLGMSLGKFTSLRSSSSRPVTAQVRRSHKSVKGQVPLFLAGITEIDIQLIYKAKCKDSSIPMLPEQMYRFYDFCERNIKDRKFDMQKSGLGPAAATEIARLLRNNFHYAQLELGRNTLTDKGAVTLVKTLSKSINLVHVGLSSNDISPEGGAAIFRALTDNQSITSFDISSHEGLNRNRLAAPGCEPLVTFFRENLILAHLNLAGTAIGPDGLEYLSAGLRGNQSLLTLNLANNGLIGKAIEPFSRSIVGTRLKHLDLASNKLGPAGAECIGRMIQGGFDGFCPLTHLDLSRNEITQAGAGRVYLAVGRNTILKSLSLEGNPLGPSSNLDLYNCLAENRVLTSLNLSSCDLRSDGITVIAEGLVRNHSLLTLNLAWNALEDPGAYSISNGLGRNDTLKTLDLSSNRIRDQGGTSICDGLRNNRCLETIIMQDNNFHDPTGMMLVEVTRVSRSLLRVNLKFNPINLKYISEINDNLVGNRQSLRKSQMPLLKNEIKRLQIREEAFVEIEVTEKKKKTEEEELKRQLIENEKKFERFKEDEERKFSVVKAKMDDVLAQKLLVGQEYASLEDEMLVLPHPDRKAQRRQVDS